MSLNGLDSPDVQAAYQTAVAEAAGWFLLKYVSRDGVELLAQGRNGVTEMRNAITAYTEASPLYGLITYRRRRTLIKYIPEGTSRLLQARTSVHMQDILERYAPYETLLEITTSDGLNDTALAKTFQLHTASPSPSVGRLDEITEDGEDAGAEGEGQSGGNASSARASGAQRYKAARKRLERADRSSSSLQVGGDSTPRSTSPAASAKPAVSQFLVHDKAGHTSITPLDLPVSADDLIPSDVLPEIEQRAAAPAPSSSLETSSVQASDSHSTTHDPEAQSSTISTVPTTPAPAGTSIVSTRSSELSGGDDTASLRTERPATSDTTTTSMRRLSNEDDPYDLAKYDHLFKPKVKLAPRPVMSRPDVARVSAVPAGFKHARKQEPLRPQSSGQGSTTPSVAAKATTTLHLPLPPPIPTIREYSPRPYSRGSVKSAPSHRSSGMTPDRLRLMKAVELRKRQLRQSQEQSSSIPPVDEEPSEMPKLPLLPATQKLPPLKIDEEEEQPAQGTERSIADEESQPQSSKADSGIEIRYDTPSYDDVNENHDGSALIPGRGRLDDFITVDEGVPAPATLGRDTPQLEQVPEIPRDASSTRQQPNDPSSIIPTIVMADGSRPATSDGHAGAGADALEHAPSSETLRSLDAVSEGADGAPSEPGSTDMSKRRRRGLVEPLQIATPSGNPDDFMSDDEFLEELHSATVEEARPIIVRSPSLPQHSFEELSTVRSVSITRKPSIPSDSILSESDRLSPEPRLSSTSPSISSDKTDPAWNPPRKVSSGISRRIQALNEMSTREASLSGYNVQTRPLTPESSSNTFLHQGRSALKAPSPAARPMSFRKKENRANQSPVTTPPLENPPIWNIQHDPATSRNSVSVTARIVRRQTDPEQEHFLPSELIINQNRDQSEKPNLDLPPIDVAAAQYSNSSSPALSPALSPASRGSTEVRTLHSASRFGRRKKTPTTPATPEFQDFPAPPKQSGSPTSTIDESSTAKSGTRTSRFFKRVSTLSGPKRRSSAQSVVSSAQSVVSVETGARTTNRASVATHQSDTPPAVVVGDLNVQFPDSLLWKRRIVTINDSGHLQFAIAQAMEIHKGVALKNFALAEFNAPYAPDLDRQELANSVMLELQDGTTLQLACEDAMTQRQVLHLLKSYWKAWTAA